MASDYTLKIKICSEAIFTGGEKESNLVQSKALTDENGFVYFHAKSLKGQLKRQGFWLLDQYKNFADQKRAEEFLGSLIALFGINDEEINLHYPKYYNTYRSDKPFMEQGIMSLSNLELPEAIRNYFLNLLKEDEESGYYRLSYHELLEAQTNIRTGIQLEDGVIKNHMFNTYHTVKEGLVFYSKLSFTSKPDGYLPDLMRIIYSLDRIGAGIHRGRGQVEAKLLIDGKEADFSNYVGRGE